VKHSFQQTLCFSKSDDEIDQNAYIAEMGLNGNNLAAD